MIMYCYVVTMIIFIIIVTPMLVMVAIAVIAVEIVLVDVEVPQLVGCLVGSDHPKEVAELLHLQVLLREVPGACLQE